MALRVAARARDRLAPGRRTEGELSLLEGAGVRAIDRPAQRRGATSRRASGRRPAFSLDLEPPRSRPATPTVRASASRRRRPAGERRRDGAQRQQVERDHLREIPRRGPPIEEDALRLRSSTTVGAQFTSRLTKTTRLTVDVFNLFNQGTGRIDYFGASRLWNRPGSVDGYLFHPAAPRGFRARLSTRF
jgi:hypothetical protein